jgi:hypothetical protein
MFFVDRNFSFPKPLSDALSEALWQAPRPAPLILDRVGRRLRSLWPSLAKERGQQVDHHYSFSADAAEAYAAHYLPANAMKLPLILEELELLGLSLGPKFKWLDVGSGPGTVMMGLWWWCKHRFKECALVNFEQSKNFIALGQSLEQSLRTTLAVPMNVSWKQSDASQLAKTLDVEKPEVISFSNSLGEVAPTLADKQALVKSLLQTSTRWLIFIEPATQVASRELLELRNIITQNSLCQVWLPCLDNRPCGALAQPQDWCHQEASCVFPDWYNELAAMAGLQKQSLLFSYLVVSVGTHPEVNWPRDSQRMVSQRLEQKGQTVCFMCTKTGKNKLRVQHSKAHDDNRYFLSIRRGELFEQIMAADKGDVISFKKISGKETATLDQLLFPKA